MSLKKSSKKTVLYPTHLSLKAKLDHCGGFLMPVQYDGIIKEHKATRTSVSLFDTCHMGKIRLSGDNVCEDLEKILTCRVDSLSIGQCRYGFICNEHGGILDDLIVVTADIQVNTKTAFGNIIGFQDVGAGIIIHEKRIIHLS